MPVIGAFMMPHPPILLPGVGRGEEKKISKTAEACREVARRIAALKPETIVLTSPHSVLYADYFHISPGEKAKGDLGQFQASSISVSVDYDTEFAEALEEEARSCPLSAGTFGAKDGGRLDHGTIIPLTFINEFYTEYKLVRIGLSGLPIADHYQLGMCIAQTAEHLNRRVVFLASGDLSHKVASHGPYGFAQEGVEFDRQLTQAAAEGDFLKFLTFPSELTEKAAECGLRSFIIMAGALDGREILPELLSYEGTFGVGYGVASFIPGKTDPSRCFLQRYEQEETRRLKEIQDQEDPYVRLARYSVEHFVNTKKRVKLPDSLPEEMLSHRAGVFVSLKKQGNLRGCIGTIAPVTDHIAEEILRNAVSACSQDPRFDPVRPDELSQLVYSVDVLSPAEPIDSPDQLDVSRYGVIVTSGRKRGLLLPNLEGVDTVEEQISISMRKAGIRPDEGYSLERFEVVRHK